MTFVFGFITLTATFKLTNDLLLALQCAFGAMILIGASFTIKEWISCDLSRIKRDLSRIEQKIEIINDNLKKLESMEKSIEEINKKLP